MAMNLKETDKTIAAFREEINRLLKAGKTPKEAVNEAYKKYPVMKVMQDELGDQLVAEAKRGGASKSIPHETLKKAMFSSWAPDGLTLSKRTTNGSEYVRATVAKAIQGTIKEGKSIRETTEKLFDGYNYGGTIPEQQIPEFMEKLTKLVNPKDYGGQVFKSTLRAAKRNLDKLSARGLKAAYKSIITAVETGNEKKVEKAVWVATQERTRFFARRIARTEMARAYGDGFWSKYAADDDVAAFQWKTSTGHPFQDICDLYAHADLYGLGPGIFPKDKVPELPAHPNCMCRLVPVYAGSLKLKREKPVDRVEEGGMEYIAKLSPHQQEMLLGVNGAKAAVKTRHWTAYARGYSGRVMQGRIKSDELTRRYIRADGKEVIDQATYHKLTKSFLKNGGIIIRGSEAQQHLEYVGADASYISGGNVAFIRDDPTVSDVIEEMYHAKQDRSGIYKDEPGELCRIKREIDAQKYLLKVAQKYKIPIEECKQTKIVLKEYLAELETYESEGNHEGR